MVDETTLIKEIRILHNRTITLGLAILELQMYKQLSPRTLKQMESFKKVEKL